MKKFQYLSVLLLSLLLLQCNSPITFQEEAEVEEPGSEEPAGMDHFVTTQNGNFTLNNQPFAFAGTNAYYLPNYEKIDPGFVDQTLDAFEDAGITVVRMWAFYDGFDCGYSQYDPDNEAVIQTSPGVYSEQSLQALDRVIAKGKERGIRFLLPFINYWDNLGGVCQYNTWAGADEPSTNLSFFLENENIQQWFRNYIDMLLNRVNTETEIAYKDEPAIFGWQVINEGRNLGQDPAVLRNWYQEIARYIKSIDTSHLVGTGEEGLDQATQNGSLVPHPEYSSDQYSNTYVIRANAGTSFVQNAAIPEIDFLTAHWYPREVGFEEATVEQIIRAQHAWLSDHLKIANEIGKPLVIGEYGFAGSDSTPDQILYEDFWNFTEQLELDGTLLWQLVTDEIKCYEVGTNICWPGGRQDRELYERFREHIQRMNALY